MVSKVWPFESMTPLDKTSLMEMLNVVSGSLNDVDVDPELDAVVVELLVESDATKSLPFPMVKLNALFASPPSLFIFPDKSEKLSLET